MIYETFDGLTDVSHDVCIVGAGPSEYRLRSSSTILAFSVLLLESGRRTADAHTSKSFPTQILSLPRFTTT